MKLIYQTDKEFLDEKTAHSWCYFLSLNFHLALWFDPDRFTHEQMKKDFAHFQATPEDDVDGEGTMLDPQKVCDYVAPGKVKYLGKFPAETEVGPMQFAVGAWQRGFMKGEQPFFHFGALSGGKCLYDPWSSNGSRSIREGKLKSIRLYQVL